MIQGKRIILRNWSQPDLQEIVGLRNDIELQSQLLARVRGSTDEQVLHWLKDRSTGTDTHLLIIADKEHDHAIGYIQITRIDYTDRRGEVGICLGKAHQGCGLGTEALSLAIEHFRTIWNFRKLTLSVRSDNARAIKCYQKLGFVQVGVFLKHIFMNGEWQDITVMELFTERKGPN